MRAPWGRRDHTPPAGRSEASTEDRATSASQAAGGPPEASADVEGLVLERVDFLIGWYERNARSSNWLHRSLRIVTLTAGALIPLITVAGWSSIWPAGLAFVIVLSQGISELGQFQRDWITFAATKERLRSEKHLYLACAGRYANARNPTRVLAEQAEAIAGGETAGWADVHTRATSPGSGSSEES